MPVGTAARSFIYYKSYNVAFTILTDGLLSLLNQLNTQRTTSDIDVPVQEVGTYMGRSTYTTG